MPSRCVVVGAGLTGLTAAHRLVRHGWDVTVFERDFQIGGHARSQSMWGIPYEPHGAHIFHTSDAQVWELVESLVEMLPYRHRVLTELRGEMFSWPLQLEELPRLEEFWPTIRHELSRLEAVDSTNFETWCVSQMGATLYELFVEGYTLKQWGRPGRELSASIGPKRVELRSDGNRDLFRDPYQGWPAEGYGALAEALADGVEVNLGQAVTVRDLPGLAAPGVPFIVTAALDDFFLYRRGRLEWRGVNLVGRWLPGVDHYQEAMVVNRPSLEVPYTRTIETKWVLGDGAPAGTLVMFEHPGSPAKHYPVPDAEGVNEFRHRRYLHDVVGYERNPLLAAGRLARYTYINMDEAMREGMDAADAVMAL